MPNTVSPIRPHPRNGPQNLGARGKAKELLLRKVLSRRGDRQPYRSAPRKAVAQKYAETFKAAELTCIIAMIFLYAVILNLV